MNSVLIAFICGSLVLGYAWLAFMRPRLALYAFLALTPTQFVFIPVADFFLSPADVLVFVSAAGLLTRLAARDSRTREAVALHLWPALMIAGYAIGFLLLDQVSRTLVRLAMAVVPAILACELLQTRRHFRWAIGALVCGALLDAGYGLYFLARGEPLHPGRFSGLMGVNFSAIVILTAAAMALARFGKTREPVKLALPASLAILGIATLSKMGVIALLLSGSVILWTVCSRANRRRVLLAGSLAVFIAVSQAPIRERLLARTTPEMQHDGVLRTSTDVRVLILESAWKALDEQPLAGIGFSSFQEFSKRDPVIFRSTAGQGYATHNSYLEVLVEGGLLAFVPFLMYLVGLSARFAYGWQVVRLRGDGVVAGLMAGCLVVLVSASVANTLLHYFFWSVCGITFACLERLRQSAAAASERSLADVV